MYSDMYSSDQNRVNSLLKVTYEYNNFIHFKPEVEIQFLSTLMSLLAQFGSALFSSKEGVPVLLSI